MIGTPNRCTPPVSRMNEGKAATVNPAGRYGRRVHAELVGERHVGAA
jgi:hypothetical protein